MSIQEQTHTSFDLVKQQAMLHFSNVFRWNDTLAKTQTKKQLATQQRCIISGWVTIIWICLRLLDGRLQFHCPTGICFGLLTACSFVSASLNSLFPSLEVAHGCRPGFQIQLRGNLAKEPFPLEKIPVLLRMTLCMNH